MFQRQLDGQQGAAARSFRFATFAGALGLLFVAGCTTHKEFQASPGPTTILTNANGGVVITSPPAGETLPPLIAPTTLDPATQASTDAVTQTSLASSPPVPTGTTIAGAPTTTAPKSPTPSPTTVVGSPSTTAKPTATTVVDSNPNCKDKGSTGGVSKDAGSLSPVVGADVRTGLHECFERVVLEFKGDGAFPGFSVQYGNAGVSGSAALLVTVGSSMSGGGTGYLGPNSINPGLTFIRQLLLISDGGGQSTWAIGLDQQRKFTVSRESSPARLVIDIQS